MVMLFTGSPTSSLVRTVPSAVRGALQTSDRFEYSQTYIEHGYKELRIPRL